MLISLSFLDIVNNPFMVDDLEYSLEQKLVSVSDNNYIYDMKYDSQIKSETISRTWRIGRASSNTEVTRPNTSEK